MKCRNVEDGQECGADLPPHAKFCGECGADVIIRTGNCPKCKETIKETQKFCFGCKWKVNESIFQSQAPTSEKEESVPEVESSLETDTPVIDEEKLSSTASVNEEHDKALIKETKTVQQAVTEAKIYKDNENNENTEHVTDTRSQGNDNDDDTSKVNIKHEGNETEGQPNQVFPDNSSQEKTQATNDTSESVCLSKSETYTSHSESSGNSEETGSSSDSSSPDSEESKNDKIQLNIDNSNEEHQDQGSHNGEQTKEQVNSKDDKVEEQNERSNTENDDEGNHDNLEDPQVTTKENVAPLEDNKNHDKEKGYRSETRISESTDSSDSSSDSEDENQDKDSHNDLKAKDQVPEDQQTNLADKKEDGPIKRSNTEHQDQGSHTGVQAKEQVNSKDDKGEEQNERSNTENDDEGIHDNLEEPQVTTKENVAPSEGNKNHDKKDGYRSERKDSESTDTSDSSSDSEDDNQDKNSHNDIKVKNQVPEDKQSKLTEDKEDDPIERSNTDNKEQDSHNDLKAMDQVPEDKQSKLTDDKEDDPFERNNTDDQSRNETDTTEPGPTQNVDIDQNQTGNNEGNNQPKNTESSSISDLSETENPEGDKIHLEIDIDDTSISSGTSQENRGACANVITSETSRDGHKQEKGTSIDSAKTKKKEKEESRRSSSADLSKNEKKLKKQAEKDKMKRTKEAEKRRKIQEEKERKEKEKENRLKKANDKKSQEHQKAGITKASLPPVAEPTNKGNSVDRKSDTKTDGKAVLGKDGNQTKTEAVTDNISASLLNPQSTQNQTHETSFQKISQQTSDNPTNVKTTDDDSITVYFHALFSPTILQNHETDDVFIRINGRDVRMNYKRTISTTKPEYKCYQYECMTVIKKRKTTPWTVMYNYFVKICGKDELEEYIFNHGKKDFTARSIPNARLIQKDIHHQFDGVVRRKPAKEKGVISYFTEFIWKSIEEYQKLLRNDVSLSFETFLPEWKTVCNGGMNGKQLIDRVQDVYNCLKTNYWSREQLWNSLMDYKKYTEQCLKPYLESGISLLVETKQSENQNARSDRVGTNITAAATIVFLQEYYGVVLNEPVISNLCTALLPDLSSKQTCSDSLAELKKNFASLEGKMQDRLLNFVKSLLRRERPFWSWLYCIPTLHYIEDRYRPFQTAPGSTNHRDKKPVWWGVDSFNSELDTFKGRSSALRMWATYDLEKCQPEVTLSEHEVVIFALISWKST